MSETMPNITPENPINYCRSATVPAPLWTGNRDTIYRLAAAVAMVLVDVASLTTAMLLAFHIRVDLLAVVSGIFPPGVPPGIAEKSLWVLVPGLLCLAYEGLYTRRLPFWRETKRVVKALTLAFLLVLAAITLTKSGSEFSRTILVMSYLLALLLVPLGRYLCKTGLARTRLWQEPVLIMGAGKTGELVAQAMLKDHYPGYRVFGFLDDDPVKQKRGMRVKGTMLSVLGGFDDAAAIIHARGIRNVIIAAPGLPGAETVNLVNKLQSYARSVTVVADLFGIPVMGGELEYFFDEQVVGVRNHNNLASPVNIAAKRFFDMIVGMIIFITMLPVMALIALAIKLDSPGPAIFSGKRLGRRGSTFKCYKFRTMFVDNDRILEEYLTANPEAQEEWNTYAKLRGYDPRVTRVGSFLRKTSLDELPQLLNVLKGEMSLVGPRPYLPREKSQMEGFKDTILVAYPGITGLWQVNGRNEIDFNGRLRLESWYVRNWSLWLDISILFRTICVVLRRNGAY